MTDCSLNMGKLYFVHNAMGIDLEQRLLDFIKWQFYQNAIFQNNFSSSSPYLNAFKIQYILFKHHLKSTLQKIFVYPNGQWSRMLENGQNYSFSYCISKWKETIILKWLNTWYSCKILNKKLMQKFWPIWNHCAIP